MGAICHIQIQVKDIQVSTTIHITVIDERMALAIISTLLNQPGVEVSIDLDEMFDLVEPNHITKRAPASTKAVPVVYTDPDFMDRATVKLHEQLWGDEAMLKHKLEREQVGAYGAKISHDGNSYYINGVKVSDAEFEAEMRKRMQAREERAVIALEAIETVDCPKCLAHRGERCVTENGHRYGKRQVHLDRELKLNRIRRDTATPV